MNQVTENLVLCPICGQELSEITITLSETLQVKDEVKCPCGYSSDDGFYELCEVF